MEIVYNYKSNLLTEVISTIRESNQNTNLYVFKQNIEYEGLKPVRISHYNASGNLATVTRLEYNGSKLKTIITFDVENGIQEENDCAETRQYDNNGNIASTVMACLADTALQTVITHEKAIGTLSDMMLVYFGWVSMTITPDFPSLYYDFKKKSSNTPYAPYYEPAF